MGEYAVRTYTTPDSGLTYLIHAQVAQTTPPFALSRMTSVREYVFYVFFRFKKMTSYVF